MAASMAKRVLVHIQKSGDVAAKQAHFTECILDYFGADGLTTSVSVRLENNDLILSNPSQSKDKSAPAVRVKHPQFCPIHHLTVEDKAQLPTDILNRGIDVGAAVLLETGDHKVLLTRRAYGMRTFPGVWVPPGGHIEQDEKIFEAGLRELHEETGIKVDSAMCVNEQVNMLALWESVFPPMKSRGLPKRHHVVVYLHAKLKPSFTSETLQQNLHLNADEVGACAWLDRSIIEGIVANNEGDLHKAEITAKLPETFCATVVDENKHTMPKMLQTSNLLAVVQDSGVDIERVSTGTKFALGEWLKNNPSTA